MTTKEIRERLIEKRTLYQNAVAEAEKACNSIGRILDSFDGESIELLRGMGFGIDCIVGVDLAKLRSDEKYVKEFSNNVGSVVEGLHKYLESQLGD